MRRAARIDDNQNEIVDALRSVGASVAITSMVGDGFPDLTVGFRDINYLIEIKDGSKPPSRRQLTRPEQVFHDSWWGRIDIVNSVDEALYVIGVNEL